MISSLKNISDTYFLLVAKQFNSDYLFKTKIKKELYNLGKVPFLFR